MWVSLIIQGVIKNILIFVWTINDRIAGILSQIKIQQPRFSECIIEIPSGLYLAAHPPDYLYSMNW